MYKSIIVIIASIFLYACKNQIAESDAYGNFEATITTISAEANGSLLFLNIEEGQKLSKGKLVGIVDTALLDLQRKQVQASIGTLPQKLQDALSEIEVLRDQKANLIRERDRIQRLLEQKAATPKQLDDLNGEIQVIDQRIASTQSQTQIANRAILSEKGPLLAQIDLINEQIRKSYIYNPVSGTVITKLSEPHEVVGPGTPLYRIAKLDTITFRFYASSSQIRNLALGDNVEVLVDSGEGQFKFLDGQVNWIATEAEFTPKTIQTREERVNLVYAIKAKVPNPDGTLKIGMPAEVNFITKTIAQ